MTELRSRKNRSVTALALIALAFSTLVAIPAVAADGQRSGAFQGRSNHVTTGGVTVTTKGGKTVLTLHSNFSLDGAPDPWIGFGKNGRFVKSTRFTKLRSNTGQQAYAVPSQIKAAGFTHVFIWCHRFSVPLGVARLR